MSKHQKITKDNDILIKEIQNLSKIEDVKQYLRTNLYTDSILKKLYNKEM